MPIYEYVQTSDILRAFWGWGAKEGAGRGGALYEMSFDHFLQEEHVVLLSPCGVGVGEERLRISFPCMFSSSGHYQFASCLLEGRNEATLICHLVRGREGGEGTLNRRLLAAQLMKKLTECVKLLSGTSICLISSQHLKKNPPVSQTTYRNPELVIQ